MASWAPSMPAKVAAAQAAASSFPSGFLKVTDDSHGDAELLCVRQLWCTVEKELTLQSAQDFPTPAIIAYASESAVEPAARFALHDCVLHITGDRTFIVSGDGIHVKFEVMEKKQWIEAICSLMNHPLPSNLSTTNKAALTVATAVSKSAQSTLPDSGSNTPLRAASPPLTSSSKASSVVQGLNSTQEQCASRSASPTAEKGTIVTQSYVGMIASPGLVDEMKSDKRKSRSKLRASRKMRESSRIKSMFYKSPMNSIVKFDEATEVDVIEQTADGQSVFSEYASFEDDGKRQIQSGTLEDLILWCLLQPPSANDKDTRALQLCFRSHYTVSEFFEAFRSCCHRLNESSTLPDLHMHFYRFLHTYLVNWGKKDLKTKELEKEFSTCMKFCSNEQVTKLKHLRGKGSRLKHQAVSHDDEVDETGTDYQDDQDAPFHFAAKDSEAYGRCDRGITFNIRSVTVGAGRLPSLPSANNPTAQGPQDGSPPPSPPSSPRGERGHSDTHIMLGLPESVVMAIKKGDAATAAIFAVDSLMQCSTSTLAEQLCLYEHELWRGFRLEEMLDAAWTKDNRAELAPTIDRLTKSFNRISLWVTTAILRQMTGAMQSECFSKFVRLARRLVRLNNFSGALQILSGLTTHIVSRLEKLKEHTSPDTDKQLQKIRALFDPANGYQAYRNCSGNLPCLPFLGVVQRDLIYVGDGNPDWEVKQKSLNFAKMRLISQCIHGWKLDRILKNPFPFKRNEFVLKCLECVEPLDEKALTSLSNLHQPRRVFGRKKKDGGKSSAWRKGVVNEQTAEKLKMLASMARSHRSSTADEKDKPRLSEKKGGKDDDSNKARKVIERVNSQTRFLGLASTFLDFLKDKVSDEVYGKVIKALEELEREGAEIEQQISAVNEILPDEGDLGGQFRALAEDLLANTQPPEGEESRLAEADDREISVFIELVKETSESSQFLDDVRKMLDDLRHGRLGEKQADAVAQRLFAEHAELMERFHRLDLIVSMREYYRKETELPRPEATPRQVAETINYCWTVRARCSPDTYTSFLEILDRQRDGIITAAEAETRLRELFAEHDDLLANIPVLVGPTVRPRRANVVLSGARAAKP